MVKNERSFRSIFFGMTPKASQGENSSVGDTSKLVSIVEGTNIRTHKT